MQQCQDWLTSILEPGSSSNTAGDGPRSAAAQCCRDSTRRKKYHTKTYHRRQESEIARTGTQPHIAPALFLPSLLSRGTKSRPAAAPSQLPPTSSAAFYRLHRGMNAWLEVRTGENITGHPLEKGVFAKCTIPPHTIPWCCTLLRFQGTLLPPGERC